MRLRIPRAGTRRVECSPMPKGKLEKVFSLYAANYRLHRPEASCPVCPICLRTIPRPDPHVASCGHCFPEGSPVRGGMVLECKRCNNNLGSECDSHFTQLLKLARSADGTATPNDMAHLWRNKATVTIGGHTAPVSVKVKGGRVDLRPHFRTPTKMPIPDADGQVRFTVSAEMFSVDRAGAAVMHSAYLRLVYWLGYEYALSENVVRLREDLVAVASGQLTPAEVEDRFARYVRTCHPRTGFDAEGLFVINSPSHARCFMIIVPLHKDRSVGILMPGFGPAGAKGFEHITRIGPPASVQLTAYRPTDDRTDRLRDAAEIACGRWMWDARAGTS